MKFLMVGIGGGIGAILRYLISAVPLKVSFPVQTFVTNVLGAILIGVVVEVVVGREISENWNLFLKVGICGGFTTFSTFSLETYNLIEKGNTGIALGYAVLSVVLSVVGVFIGRGIVRVA
ncbi:fluoride efflux transporter CrcB [Leptotrichia trevisanii]|uniref:Fluoride-specific ion channel FluC n=1 Tax=Leptotrichia trevisanii TaxID=109328 RepID=A0A510K3Y6_9FUSO|nr:fluoride efflux transporter CrcB [Leptotrichia trevisanii]BBM46359.1 CrcB protein [Leptotrichia trevisanii]